MDKRMREFEEACKPVIEYLRKYYNPMCKVIISDGFSEVVVSDIGVPNEVQNQNLERRCDMPVLWKYDTELGIAYFCPHCKTFQCAGSGACTVCGGEIEWDKRIKYRGKVFWN